MMRDSNGNEIFPGEATHPGEMLADELETRMMSQKELAEKTGLSPAFISALIRGKKSVSLSTSLKLEQALEINAEFWIKAQNNYNRTVAYLKAKQELKQLNLSVARQQALLAAIA